MTTTHTKKKKGVHHGSRHLYNHREHHPHHCLHSVLDLGSAFSTLASIGPVISTILEKGGDFLDKILNAANLLLCALSLLKPNETIEEFGERALQAAQKGITLDRFDNFEQYLNELRNFPLDLEIAKNRSPLERQTAAIMLSTITLKDKWDLTDRDSFAVLTLLVGASDYFTPERVRDWIATGRLVYNIFDYLNQRLSGEDAARVERHMSAGLSDDEKRQLYAALDEVRNLFKPKGDTPSESR